VSETGLLDATLQQGPSFEQRLVEEISVLEEQQIEGEQSNGDFLDVGGNRALVAMASGMWAGADVIARHKNLDLSLLWLSRQSGSGTFVQPVLHQDKVSEGENIFVIGHPQGLRYTLSTGIVSRTDPDALQISAPVSPGNSGGPVYDERGNLIGIVTSMIDRNINPNAENLNFAVRADAVFDPDRWDCSTNGRKHLTDFVAQSVRRNTDSAHER
jgi:hypothetical protein